MQIAYVQFFDFPTSKAHGSQILHTAQGLASLGHDVYLFPQRKSKKPTHELLKTFYGLEQSVRLHVHPVGGPLKGLRSVAYRKKLFSFGRRSFARDVFFVRNLRHGLWLDKLRKLHGWPLSLVYEFHNLQHVVASEGGNSRKARFFMRLEKEMVDAADALIPISQPLANDIQKIFPNDKPLLILPDGVDLTKFKKTSKTYKHEDGSFSLVYAGSLYRNKGVGTLLDMMAALPEFVHLTIVGGNSPEDLKRLRNETAQMSLDSRVHFIGQVMTTEVPEYLAKADAIVIPSGPGVHSQRYTSPLKLFESMAIGLPLVVAATDTLLSVLKADENAIVADGLSGASLAEAVTRLLEDPLLGAKVGARASTDAFQYGWDERARRLASFLLELDSRVSG